MNRETDQKPAPKAFSYLRFSTPEQERGDSYRRQQALAQDWALRKGLALDDRSYQDLGVSAYHGANAETGKLGEFMKAVAAGIIPEGSYLLIESLDRLSRNKPRKAVRLLETVCESGINVVTLSDQKEYTQASLDNDSMGFMWAFMIATRAHEESATKARRLKAAWSNKRQKGRDNKTPITSRGPAWLKLDKASGTWELIPERVAVVRRIFDLAVQGVGLEATVKTLNREGVPTFGKSPQKRGGRPIPDVGERQSEMKPQWFRAYVKKIRENPSVTGTYIPHKLEHRDGRKVRVPQDPIPDYFPAVIDEATFNAVAARTVTREPRDVNGRIRHILASLARCPVCGGTMHRVNKGRPNRPWDRLVCTRAKQGAGCDYKSINLDLVINALIHGAGNIVADAPSGDPELDKALLNIEGALSATHDAMENIMEAIEKSKTKGRPSDALIERLGQLEDDKRELEQEQRSLLEKASRASPAMLDDRLSRLEETLQSRDPVKGNALMRELFSAVVVDHQSGYLRLVWNHGGETLLPYDGKVIFGVES